MEMDQPFSISDMHIILPLFVTRLKIAFVYTFENLVLAGFKKHE